MPKSRVPKSKVVLFETSEDDQAKAARLNWLISLIKSGESEFQVYKALVCLKNLCNDWSVVLQLYDRNILSILKRVLSQDKPQLVKVIA